MIVQKYHAYPERGDRFLGLMIDYRHKVFVVDIGFWWRRYTIIF